MKIEDIIALSNAGFTKNDIMAMCGQNQNQHIPVQNQQMQVQNQQMQVQNQQMPNAYYSYGGYNQQSHQIGEQNDVLSALRNLTRSVQSNNVNMMQNQMPKQVTTEDAIASIINPPNYEGLKEGGMK